MGMCVRNGADLDRPYQKQILGHHTDMDVKFLKFVVKKGEKISRFQFMAMSSPT